jgi:hypothetical protein
MPFKVGNTNVQSRNAQIIRVMQKQLPNASSLTEKLEMARKLTQGQPDKVVVPEQETTTVQLDNTTNGSAPGRQQDSVTERMAKARQRRQELKVQREQVFGQVNPDFAEFMAIFHQLQVEHNRVGAQMTRLKAAIQKMGAFLMES